MPYCTGRRNAGSNGVFPCWKAEEEQVNRPALLTQVKRRLVGKQKVRDTQPDKVAASALLRCQLEREIIWAKQYSINMGKLLQVSSVSAGQSKVAVIFVHGLGGDANESWRTNKDTGETWPSWVTQEFPDAFVSTLQYRASPSVWFGRSIPLFDRAKQLLALVANLECDRIVFVCHSLGGLLVKEAMHQSTSSQIQGWTEVAHKTSGIVFLGTPQTGSALANIAQKFRYLLRPSISVKELQRNEAQLRKTDEWYRNNADLIGVETLSFYETLPTKGLMVVDQAEANPGIRGAKTIPVDADHVGICKPQSKSDITHLALVQFLRGCFRGISGEVPELDETPAEVKLPWPQTDESTHQPSTVVGSRKAPYPSAFISFPGGDRALNTLAKELSQELTLLGMSASLRDDLESNARAPEDEFAIIGKGSLSIFLISSLADYDETLREQVAFACEISAINQRNSAISVLVNRPTIENEAILGALSDTTILPWRSSDNSKHLADLLISCLQDAKNAEVTDQTASIEIVPENALAPYIEKPSKLEIPEIEAQNCSSHIRLPGGTIRRSDQNYVRRSIDNTLDKIAESPGQTLTIRGARQVGKSSLLMGYLNECRSHGKRTIFIDFQSIPSSILPDYPSFLKFLAVAISRELHFGVEIREREFDQQSFTYFLEDEILSRLDGDVAFAIDEADRILGQPYQSDFFSLLRYWHNLRANPESAWRLVDLALVISTEPYLLIASDDRSPFNVTPPIYVAPFTRQECHVLNKLHVRELTSQEVDQLFDLLEGHPYLTSLVHYSLDQSEQSSLKQIVEREEEIEHGLFGDHLRSRYMLLRRHDGALEAMTCIAAGNNTSKTISDENLFRLKAVGLVASDENKIKAANRLYQTYFSRYPNQ